MKEFRCNRIGCQLVFNHPEKRRRHQDACAKPVKQGKYTLVGDRFGCPKCGKTRSRPEFRPEFSLKFRFRPDFLFWPEFQAGILIKIVSNNWCKMFVKTQ